MDAEVKAKWVAALRSGGYTQAQGALRKGDSFCCLGVLCDLYDREKKADLWVKDVPSDPDDWGYEYGDHCSTPPGEVWSDWAVMPDDDPAITTGATDGGKVYSTLAALNDDGYTFAQIADLIEAQL